MTKLRFLDVGHSRVNDDLFELLESLDHLEHLAFGGNKMSGAALPSLKSLPALRELSVSGQQRTDSGLWSVSVTDFNIGHIAQLRSTGSSRPGRDQRLRSGHRGAGATEESAHAGPQGNPGDQQGNRGPDRPAEAAASEALEGQGHRRRGGPGSSSRWKTWKSSSCRRRASPQGAGAAFGEEGLETALHRRRRHHAGAGRGPSQGPAGLPGELVEKADDPEPRAEAARRQLMKGAAQIAAKYPFGSRLNRPAAVPGRR